MFAFLGNVIWFITGGIITGTLYFLFAVILFPLLPSLLPLVGYAYFPFGRRPVSKSVINAYKREKDLPLKDSVYTSVPSSVKLLVTILWMILLGWILAIAHFVAPSVNLVLCLLLVTIPFTLPAALGNFKMIRVAFSPFSVKILPNSLADEIEAVTAKANL